MNMKLALRSISAAGALCLAGTGLAAEKRPEAPPLKPGFRAVSFAVDSDEIAAVASGDRVDVLITFDAKTKEGVETVTATIIQNVLVIGSEGQKVHLMLKPEEAQYALLAIHAARQAHIIKRPPGDEEMRPLEIASFRKLFR